MGQQKGNPIPSVQNQAYEALRPNTGARENRDYGTKPVMIDDTKTLNELIDSGSQGFTSGYAKDSDLIDGTINARFDTLTANEYHITILSSSVLYANGSNKFGNSGDDRHEFTGSLNISGSIILQNGAVIKDTTGTAISFGKDAGVINQGTTAVAIGDGAGYNTQGAEAVAVGKSAGNATQGPSAIAVGYRAGDTTQGASAIAIGKSAGQTSQTANTIILNATGVAVNGVAAQSSSFYVAPIRNIIGTDGVLQYNATTKEVTYNNAIPFITASLQPLMNGKTDLSAATGTVTYDCSNGQRVFSHFGVNASANWIANFTNLPMSNNEAHYITVISSNGSSNANTYFINGIKIDGVNAIWTASWNSGAKNTYYIYKFVIVNTVSGPVVYGDRVTTIPQ